jgi:hypothetical protein
MLPLFANDPPRQTPADKTVGSDRGADFEVFAAFGILFQAFYCQDARLFAFLSMMEFMLTWKEQWASDLFP